MSQNLHLHIVFPILMYSHSLHYMTHDMSSVVCLSMFNIHVMYTQIIIYELCQNKGNKASKLPSIEYYNL